jgi:hypothetical protein
VQAEGVEIDKDGEIGNDQLKPLLNVPKAINNSLAVVRFHCWPVLSLSRVAPQDCHRCEMEGATVSCSGS